MITTAQKRFLIVILVIATGVWLLFHRWTEHRENSQDHHILAAARKHGVDPALVKAVVWRESRFKPRVRGEAGEVGLMQVGKLAAKEWADAEKIRPFYHRHLYDPGKNTMAGTWYLAKLLRRYSHTDRPAVYALADYNAGRTHVLRWNQGAARTNNVVFLEQMTYPGTRNYILSILERQEHYRGTFPTPSK